MTKLYSLWLAAWRLRLYVVAAIAVALLVASLGSLLVSTHRQNQADAQRDADNARRDTDEAALHAAIARITVDEGTISQLIDQNRNAINNNSAQVGSNKLDISDLRTLVEQAKTEVLRQLDGISNVGPPAGVDTVAAKLLAILQRLDALEARVAALETAESPSPSDHPAPPPPTRRGAPPSPAHTPPPPSNEHCIAPPSLFCSTAHGSDK
jgi:hypothetical protein